MRMTVMHNQTFVNAHQLLEDKEKVPRTFNKIARRYDFATLLSQGYSKDLKRSVLDFPSPIKFKKILFKIGFEQVTSYPQKSWRKYILHTFIARKPV